MEPKKLVMDGVAMDRAIARISPRDCGKKIGEPKESALWEFSAAACLWQKKSEKILKV